MPLKKKLSGCVKHTMITMKFSDNSDVVFMQQALALAKKGEYSARPNPCVGCVMVKDGKVIATGLHWQAGAAHAEVNALLQADCKGATCYVTLEPCSHHGRTPPCVQALIAAKVSRVVIASQDPNPLVRGKGIQSLMDAGIAVSVGLLEKEAIALNKGFYSRMQRNLPFVRAKIAMSLDAKVAMSNGESQWITTQAARNHAHLWRARSGAIITTSETVLHDNCRLTVRDEKALALDHNVKFQQPWRILVDSQLRVAKDAAIFHQPGKTTVVTLKQAKNHVVLPEKDGKVNLFALLSWLSDCEINDVMIEAGETFVGALLKLGLIDELLIYLSPKILGTEARSFAKLTGLSKLSDALQGTLTHVEKIDKDLFIIISMKENENDNQYN
ncbi:MAG: bifunctional diaminohydroxyphosphoribosylaminopyrimidine deaminase/5-amino-6-(5-phosphoribosylamino)uracil reductase RibD [Proteobacteria bacterium]|nr:bifunctional diaminohydroxyphosphoribosylaminopyrimidine deaminase/5-amino-6-(5-phosphoribosylamino)uracil reductase RibD [Pseudomonadota bacterium]